MAFPVLSSLSSWSLTSVTAPSTNFAWSYAGRAARTQQQLHLPLSFSSEPIVAWRAWTLVNYERRGDVSEHRLAAVGVCHVWTPGHADAARCNFDSHRRGEGAHEAPWASCNCGYWGFRSRDSVINTMMARYQGLAGKVIGEIAMWGRVLECEEGWRSEYAYPLSLEFFGREDVATDVAARYGVPYIAANPPAPDCTVLEVETTYDYDRTIMTVIFACGAVASYAERAWVGLDGMKEAPTCPAHGKDR